MTTKATVDRLRAAYTAKLNTYIAVVKAQCEMLEIEDAPFLRRVHAESMMTYALKVKAMVDDEEALAAAVLATEKG